MGNSLNLICPMANFNIKIIKDNFVLFNILHYLCAD